MHPPPHIWGRANTHWFAQHSALARLDLTAPFLAECSGAELEFGVLSICVFIILLHMAHALRLYHGGSHGCTACRCYLLFVVCGLAFWPYEECTSPSNVAGEVTGPRAADRDVGFVLLAGYTVAATYLAHLAFHAGRPFDELIVVLENFFKSQAPEVYGQTSVVSKNALLIANSSVPRRGEVLEPANSSYTTNRRTLLMDLRVEDVSLRHSVLLERFRPQHARL